MSILLECMTLNEREDEFFKGGFRKKFRLEWNSLQETRLRIQLAKKQSTKQQSTRNYNWLFLRNNRLFILAKQQQLNLNEFKGRKRYTNNLYRFTLKPRATSNPQNPLGNPLSNQLQICTVPYPSVDKVKVKVSGEVKVNMRRRLGEATPSASIAKAGHRQGRASPR